MNLSKLNPFRKSPTIYNWDNNWRPEILKAVGPDGSPSHISLTIPNSFYAIVSLIDAFCEHDGALGTSTMVGNIYRGSDIIFPIKWGLPIQTSSPTHWFLYHSSTLFNVGSTQTYARQPLPPDFAILPGDRIEVDIDTAKGNQRNSSIQLYLKAYYI